MYDGDLKLTKETIDIENAGNTASVRMAGATVLSLSIRGDGTAEFVLDARLSKNDDWVQDIFSTYAGAADYDDVVETGMPEVRVRCTSGSGVANDTATVRLAAGGG